MADAAEKLEHLSDLTPELGQAKELLSEVFEELGPGRARLFVEEIMQALIYARSENDLRPLNQTVERWTRAMAFVRQGFTAADLMSAESIRSAPASSLAEIRERLRL